jgi:HSP20 family protein
MFSLVPWKKKDGSLKPWRNRDAEFGPPARFREEFDALWNRFFGEFGGNLSAWDEDFRFGFHDQWEDRSDAYVFRAELPGFEPDEIDVKVSGNMLTVKAERQEKSDGKNGSSVRYGSYQRSFQLPYGVKDDSVEAAYRHGVLEVRLPKSEEAGGKRIAVKAD